MGYSIKHLRIDSKHILALIDDHTTLPSLFVAIYSVRRLSLLRFRTQEKELSSKKQCDHCTEVHFIFIST